jgi:hypothetical protein
MSDKTNYSQQRNLESNAGISPSGTRYLAVNTAAGTDALAGTECSDANYARQVVTWNTPTVNSGDVSTTNSNAPTYPAFAVAQTIVEWALYDAITGGNRIYHKGITSQAVASGNQLSFPAGALTLKEQ